jgi:hypothetical protein
VGEKPRGSVKKTAAVDELPTLQETKPPKLTTAQRQVIREQARGMGGRIRPARSEDPTGSRDLLWIKPAAYNAATDFLNTLDDDALCGYIIGVRDNIKAFGRLAEHSIPAPSISVNDRVLLWLAEMILRTRSQLPKAKVEALYLEIGDTDLCQ